MYRKVDAVDTIGNRNTNQSINHTIDREQIGIHIGTVRYGNTHEHHAGNIRG